MPQPQADPGGSQKDIRKDWTPRNQDYSEAVLQYREWWPFPDGATGPEADEVRARRERNAPQVCIDYYNVVSPSYERGWGQQFHYCPMVPGKTIKESLIEYEVLIGKLTGLRDGIKVLDVGCGIGGPARTISKTYGCKVVGLVNSPWHVERGSALNKEAGLQDMIEMVQGDYHHLPFEDNTFDAAYSFEAICYAPDVTIPYSEIQRVLKPGGMFGYTEWVMTDKFDSSIEMHRVIRDRIERGNGIAKMPHISDIRTALQQCGFEIISEEQMQDRSTPGPWWYPLVGKVQYATCQSDRLRTLAMEPKVVGPLRNMLYRVVSHIGVAPKGLPAAFEIMKTCTGGVSMGGREDIFTPLAVFIARSMK